MQLNTRDIERMKELTVAFPGAALIFATLNSELQESEVKLIRNLTLAERKKRLHGKPCSHVILLTATELFSRHIGENWKNKGGLYERLSQRSFELTQLEVLLSNFISVSLPGPSVCIRNGKNKGKSRQEGKQRAKRRVIDIRQTTKNGVQQAKKPIS